MRFAYFYFMRDTQDRVQVTARRMPRTGRNSDC